VELSAQLAEATALLPLNEPIPASASESAKATKSRALALPTRRDQCSGHRFDVTAGASLGAGTIFYQFLDGILPRSNAFDI